MKTTQHIASPRAPFELESFSNGHISKLQNFQPLGRLISPFGMANLLRWHIPGFDSVYAFKMREQRGVKRLE